MIETEELLDLKAIRPRFTICCDHSPQELCAWMNDYLSSSKALVRGKVFDRYGTFRIPAEEQHYWSPQLSFSMDQDEEGTHVRGLIGPRPSVWTMFVFFYVALGFTALIIGMVGLSYRSIGEESNLLWWVPLLLLIFGSLYLIAYLGKQKSRREMVRLLQAFEEASGLEVEH